MIKSDILDLVQDIARDQADADAIDAYYDEAVEELGKLQDPPMQERALVEFTSGTATYDYPVEAVEILHAFHASYQLPRTTKEALEAYDMEWRSGSGVPKVFKTDQENARTYRLYPNPNVTSDALGGGATEPFGEDFPANSGALIYSDARATGISDMIGLYIAFRVLYKEFMRPSDHQDAAWAALHKKIADLLFKMGVMRHGKEIKSKATGEAGA